MKPFGLLALFAAIAFAQTPGPRTVYVMGLGGDMDQYLASAIARDGVLQVVTDPKLADTILTASVGPAFQQRMDAFYPPAEKAAETTHPFQSSAVRGTIFLVDVKTRHVLWSVFEKGPGSRSPAAMNRVAGKIAKKLRETFPK